MNSSGKSFFLLITGLLLSYSVLAQESDCNNGIDDDGDGFVDCFDSECSGEGSCEEFFVGNEITCQEEPTDNPTLDLKLQWSSPDESANSHATPAVGDIDQDGSPEVVVTNKQNRTLAILDGVFGQYDANLPNPTGAVGPIALSYQPENDVALGDFDGDGYASIIVSQDKGRRIERFEFNPVLEEWSQSGVVLYKNPIELVSLVSLISMRMVQLRSIIETRSSI